MEIGDTALQHSLKKTDSILSSFLSLGLSSAGSQAASLFCVFLLAKFLGPSDFGGYSLFFAYSSLIVVVSSLSLEQAFPSAEAQDYQAVVSLSTMVAVACSFCAYLAAELAGYTLASLLGLMVLANSIGRLGELMAVREKMYTTISIVRLAPNLLFLFMLLALIYWDALDLTSAVVANLLSFSVAWVGIYIVTYYGRIKFRPTYSLLKAAFKRERRFVFYVAPSQLFNRLALTLPLLLIDKAFGSSLAGQFALINRLGFGPVNLIGSAMSQIFLGHLGEVKRSDVIKGSDFPYFAIRKNLVISGILVLISFVTIAPIVIPMVFGEGWNDAVNAGIWLAPCLGITLMAFPMTVIFTVNKMHKFLFVNQIAYSLISAFSFGLGFWGFDFSHCIICFSALSTARYVILYRKANKLIERLIV